MKEWANQSVISERSFRLVDILPADSYQLEGKTFEDCTIYGPVVVVMLGLSVMEHNSFDAPPEALLWILPPERTTVVGAIALVNCRFYRCKFRGVGVAGPKELLDEFYKASANSTNH